MGSKAVYWIVGVIVLIVLGYAGYRFWHHYTASSGTMIQYNTPSTSNTTVNSSSPSGTANTSGGASSSEVNSTNSSNGQLDQDLQNIQTNLNQLNVDQGAAGQAISGQTNDTPSQQ